MSNAELHAVRTSTVSGTGSGIAAANPLVSAVSRLVPFSGIQFIDLAVRTASLSATAGKFIEEPDPEFGRLLIPLSERADCDGVEWHPLTGERLSPSQTLWISGFQALEPFLGSWIPLPYLRFLGRGEDGEPRHDKGPSNWVRIFFEQPAEGLRNADVVRAVLAIDTQVDAAGRMDQHDYLFPNNDDVVFAPMFRLASDASDIDHFLASDWFDAWLTRLYAKFQGPDAGLAASFSNAAMPRPAFSPAFNLERVARYLSMLKVLDTALDMPQLQFIDVRSAHWRTRSSGVDLLIDIDTEQTSAAIVPSRDEPPNEVMPATQALRLRDLACPTRTHEGSFPTVAEFSPPDFGDEHASLRSGRLDAFYWPSLVRVGAEGQRLSHATGASPGQTGLAGFADALEDAQAHADIWRFCRSDAASQSDEPGAIVAGRLLSHVTEDGRIITDDAQGLQPALRPRFSSSSILSMFIAECVLHAMTQLADPDHVSRSGHLRTLKRVLVTCPLSASPDERDQVKARVEQALDQIWSALGWNRQGDFTPLRPVVALNIDAGLSSQVVYLHDEIEQRFSGGVRQFASIVGRFPCDRRNGGTAGLRIATLDLAGRSTTLCVVDYAVAASGTLTPSIEVADRTAVAGDSLTQTVINAHILPAIAATLDAAGHPDGAALLVRAIEATAKDSNELGRYFSAGFMHKTLIPAAAALIEVHQAVSGTSRSAIIRRLSLGHLVALGHGCLAPLDARLEALAAREGARAFCLADVSVVLDAHDLSHTISQHFAEPLALASDACRVLRADLVLLTGRYADLAEVSGLIETALPLSPHRIVNMNERSLQTAACTNANSATALGVLDPRLAMLVGSASCGRSTNAQFDQLALLADDLRLASPPCQASVWLSRGGVEGSPGRRVAHDGTNTRRAITHDTSAATGQHPLAEGAA